jgi:hypothetical protein
MSVTYRTVSVHFGFANPMLKPCDRTGWSSSRWCRSILHRRASRRRIRSHRESRGVVGSSAAAAAAGEDPSGGAVAEGDRATGRLSEQSRQMHQPSAVWMLPEAKRGAGAAARQMARSGRPRRSPAHVLERVQTGLTLRRIRVLASSVNQHGGQGRSVETEEAGAA